VVHADLERRFGGLRRLYGDAGYRRLRAARVAIVGVGGVGSWAAEALARSGVAELVLIDMDHVAESNINRQVQALGATTGMAKVQALAERIADIHPACSVRGVEEFVTPDNWPGLLPHTVDGVIDACDQVLAKQTLCTWALQQRQPSVIPLVTVGAAGGKRRAEAVAVADLAEVTHDPLLASLRQRLRRLAGAKPAGQGAIGIDCVHSRESVQRPSGDDGVPAGLNCHGYGSTVMVTATFGLVAAGALVERLLQDA
jgi:tRNA threonylcarbamoyladenosine dehydratase